MPLPTLLAPLLSKGLDVIAVGAVAVKGKKGCRESYRYADSR